MKSFGERYCQSSFAKQYERYGGASNLAELNAVLKNSVMVRRLKKEVLTQLPSKRRQQVRCLHFGEQWWAGLMPRVAKRQGCKWHLPT